MDAARFIGRRIKSVPFWIGLAVVVLVALLASRRLQQVQAAASETKAPVRARLPVKTMRAQRGVVRAWVHGQGTARAVRREYLLFESQGKITYVKPGTDGGELREGDRVRGPKGDEEHGELLAQLDDRDEVEDVKVAESELKQAMEQEVAARADLDRAKAQRELAESNLRRDTELAKKDALTPSQLDVTKAQAKESEAAVTAASAQVNVAMSAVAAARARIAQSQVALDRTRLYAPIDGIVAYLNIKKGQYHAPDFVRSDSEEALLKTIPMLVIDPSQYEIGLEIPSFEGALVKEGQAAHILLSDDLSAAAVSGTVEKGIDRDGVLMGKVFAVNPAVSPGGRATQLKVRTVSAAERLRDGMFVTCWIVVHEANDVVTVPYGALIYRNQKSYTFVVDPKTNTVDRREVHSGVEDINGVEVLAGIAEGEMVVTEGRHRLTNGAMVEIVGSVEEAK